MKKKSKNKKHIAWMNLKVSNLKANHILLVKIKNKMIKKLKNKKHIT